MVPELGKTGKEKGILEDLRRESAVSSGRVGVCLKSLLVTQVEAAGMQTDRDQSSAEGLGGHWKLSVFRKRWIQ